MAVATDTVWDSTAYWSEAAEQAFTTARRKAGWHGLIDRIRGRNPELLRFDEVAERLELLPESGEHLRTIPLEKIVGTVGTKGRLFTRTFHPKTNTLLPRWKRVYTMARGLRGYRPIDVYEAVGAFYVVDGHFRVSVARALGSTMIQARIRRWT